MVAQEGCHQQLRKYVLQKRKVEYCSNGSGARQSPWLLVAKQNSNSPHQIKRIEMKQQGFTSVGQKEEYKPTVEF